MEKVFVPTSCICAFVPSLQERESEWRESERVKDTLRWATLSNAEPFSPAELIYLLTQNMRQLIYVFVQ